MQFLEYLDKKHPEVSKSILTTGKLDEAKAGLEKALKEFDSVFAG